MDGRPSQIGFWSLSVPAESTISLGLDARDDVTEIVRITNVALADLKPGDPTVLKLKSEGSAVVTLATLQTGVCHQIHVNISLSGTVELLNSGATDVHLCGYKTVTLDRDLFGNYASARRAYAAQQNAGLIDNEADEEDEDEDEGEDEDEDDDGEDEGEDEELEEGYPELDSDDLVAEVMNSSDEEEDEDEEDEPRPSVQAAPKRKVTAASLTHVRPAKSAKSGLSTPGHTTVPAQLPAASRHSVPAKLQGGGSNRKMLL
jgi:hypothetical protein